MIGNDMTTEINYLTTIIFNGVFLSIDEDNCESTF